MKVKFSTVDCCEGFKSTNQKLNSRLEITYFGFDTQEVTAWTLITLGDKSRSLELWLKGVAELLNINEQMVGTPNFQSILLLLESEFANINDLKGKTL